MDKYKLRTILFYMHHFGQSFSTKQIANTLGVSFREARNIMRQKQRDGQVHEKNGKWYSRNYSG